MSIIKTANKMMDEALEEESIAQYSLDLGVAHTKQTIFDYDGKIFSHLPRYVIQIGYGMG